MNPKHIAQLGRRLALAATACLGAIMAPAAAASGFPSKPVTIIVAFPPGGPADVATRSLVDALAAQLGQPVVVENRAGASGNIGTLRVARAEPDGYTLTMATGATHGINPFLYKDIGYDPVKDFAPIAFVSTTPNVLVANNQFPAKTVAELVALAKQGKLDIATSGQGSTQDMSARLLAREAGIELNLVHYRGSAPARTDVMAGHVPLMFDAVSSAMPFITSGQLHAIAVTSPEAAEGLPDVPPVAKTLPGYEVGAWYALVAPAGTPADVIAVLNKAVNGALANPEVRARYATQGARIIGGTPEQLAAHVVRETERWSRLIREAGISYQ